MPRAAWQASRQSLSWPEKIRLAEQLRDSLRLWCVKPARKTLAVDPERRSPNLKTVRQ